MEGEPSSMQYSAPAWRKKKSRDQTRKGTCMPSWDIFYSAHLQSSEVSSFVMLCINKRSKNNFIHHFFPQGSSFFSPRRDFSILSLQKKEPLEAVHPLRFPDQPKSSPIVDTESRCRRPLCLWRFFDERLRPPSTEEKWPRDAYWSSPPLIVCLLGLSPLFVWYAFFLAGDAFPTLLFSFRDDAKEERDESSFSSRWKSPWGERRHQFCLPLSLSDKCYSIISSFSMNTVEDDILLLTFFWQ